MALRRISTHPPRARRRLAEIGFAMDERDESRAADGR